MVLARDLSAIVLCVGASVTMAEEAVTSYTVLGKAGVGGTLTPLSQVVEAGEPAILMAKPKAGYAIASVVGCDGRLSGNLYRTAPVTANCTVEATFKAFDGKFIVKATAGTGGTISPATRTVSKDETTTFTVKPNSGYQIATVIGCNGTLSGNTYTTGAITANCVVAATFNKISMANAMVRITGGCFQIGSADWEIGRDDDEWQHEVCVNDFEISKYEVTFEEYDRFADATGRSKPDDNGWGRGKRPVIYVDFSDVNAYAAWMSEKTGQTYRLPTEAEWEYAARAGTTTARFWGDDEALMQACAYANVADQTALVEHPYWTVFNCTDGYAGTAPVGTFKPNPFGLYDMSGNIWEWTCSAYSRSYNGAENTCTTEDDIGDGDIVMRGGSWYDAPDGLRSAFRYADSMFYSESDTGFRLVRELR